MKRLISIILIVIITITICSIPNESNAWCNTIRFTNDINAVQLILSNGQILYDLQLERTAPSTISYANIKNLNIIFIVNVENNLNESKTAMKNFMDYMYTDTNSTYSSYPLKISAGIIPFKDLAVSNNNTNQNILIKNQSNANQIKTQINNIDAHTTQSLEDALKIARYNYTSPYDPDEDLRILIFITDRINTTIGNSSMLNSSKSIFKSLGEYDMVSLYGILINSNKSDYNQLFSETIINTIENINAGGIDFELKSQVPAYIESKALSTYKLQAKSKNSGALITPADIILTIDEEIVHGATLKIEYNMGVTFDSTTGTSLGANTHIYDEKDNRLSYSKDERLLSDPNRTNESQGWYLGSMPVTGESVLINDNAYNGSNVKLVFNYMVTSETLNNSSFNNMATLKADLENGGSVIGNRTFSERAQTIILLPPFGTKSILPISFGGKNMFNIEGKKVPNELICEIGLGIIIIAGVGIIILKTKNRRNKY